jgi:spore coat protein U-like protein
MKRLLIAATALIGILTVQDALAATAGSTISVSASVGTACGVSATPLLFRTVAPGANTTTGTATVTVTCTSGGAYDVGLDYGANSNPGTQRNLLGTNLGGLVTYGLFQDSAALTTPWGPVIGTNTLHETGNGSAQAWTVYGKIPGSQGPAGDAYTDTVNVTVTY